MEMRLFPATDLEVSVLALGCNNFGPRLDQDGATEVTRAALDSGITHFDTANSYWAGASERLLGRALGSRRDEAVIATKFGMKNAPDGGGTSAQVVRDSCEASLERLGTDRIDLFYVHFPDESTAIEETLRALDELVQQGKVRHVACSNFSSGQVREAIEVATDADLPRFVASQVQWNLLERGVEQEDVPTAQELGLGIVPFFPLASGVLTGKYRADAPPPADSRAANWSYFSDIATPERLARVERLSEVAARYDRSIVDLALGWIASQPAVISVLAGATSVRQVESNVAAASWRLTDEQLSEVDATL
ncbi:aldo/keto reductase [Dietzia lutea]|uniref:NADP-dependent oxidoreductase domain-containing protein n=1 Tax=Dietzia lutea TaxID=546160 RepID=A0A2S1RA03_9ACTN|nr:aldo/keto reductase [Dietzia lutea]AWH93061.1 hypothetical protein A6035_13770 [Dietzia lutea]